jgi:hypothetical protein
MATLKYLCGETGETTKRNFSQSSGDESGIFAKRETGIMKTEGNIP